MALEFKQNWNKENPGYATRYGSYQAYLDSVTESDVKRAIYRAITFAFDVDITSILKKAVDPAGDVIAIEQGSHQVEPPKDASGGFTLHITLRHKPTNRAYHAYLAQNNDGSWYFTTFTYFVHGSGLKTVQTGGRAFMEGLQKQYAATHPGE